MRLLVDFFIKRVDLADLLACPIDDIPNFNDIILATRFKENKPLKVSYRATKAPNVIDTIAVFLVLLPTKSSPRIYNITIVIQLRKELTLPPPKSLKRKDRESTILELSAVLESVEQDPLIKKEKGLG